MNYYSPTAVTNITIIIRYAFAIREFANNVSQTPLAKIRNIINQYGRKPLRGTVLFANSV